MATTPVQTGSTASLPKASTVLLPSASVASWQSAFAEVSDSSTSATKPKSSESRPSTLPSGCPKVPSSASSPKPNGASVTIEAPAAVRSPLSQGENDVAHKVAVSKGGPNATEARFS